ncbi:PhnA domain-containing protein [Pannonibacter phragmitetus]|uniref:PhnA domain-containing protein n=1 Tax=Pannonibacter phragmitetus TaxID=121719 RepID=UPI0009EB19AE
MGCLFLCPEARAAPHWLRVQWPVRPGRTGNLRADGGTVSLIKNLKLKGSSRALKFGTKVRGISPIGLKSEFVKMAA